MTLHAPKLQKPPHPQPEPFGTVVRAKRFDDTTHL